ncbi:MAG: hypothetical protein HQL96_13375, partial [Magnetococcales bacterium]|nr:hypothetical protein [Magnetococcales bacterium]
MNPRYPTSNQYRRHRTRKPGRLILLGALGVLVAYFIFSSPSPKKAPPPPAAPSVAGEEIAEHLKTATPPLPSQVAHHGGGVLGIAENAQL